MCEFEKIGEDESDGVVNMKVLVLGISWLGMI
jgi:hypothetical protein